jgi:hypothetical protein
LAPNSNCVFYFFSYEKRAEYEHNVRSRNVVALHRQLEDELTSAPVTRRKRQPNTAIDAMAVEKAPKHSSTPVQSWREKRDADKQQNAAAAAQPEPEVIGWREKMAQQQKSEQEAKTKRQQEMVKAAKSAQAAVSAASVGADQMQNDLTSSSISVPVITPAEDSSKPFALKAWREKRAAAKRNNAAAAAAEPEAEIKSWQEKLAEKQKEQEAKKKQEKSDANSDPDAEKPEGEPVEPVDDDPNGTKKMKSDFDLMMSSLDTEIESGRSNLARIRERIRKAKATCKPRDDQDDSKTKS